jgi:hypothetical protein
MQPKEVREKYGQELRNEIKRREYEKKNKPNSERDLFFPTDKDV